MHLLTFLQLSQPGYLTRAAVLLTQGILCACCLLLCPYPLHCSVVAHCNLTIIAHNLR